MFFSYDCTDIGVTGKRIERQIPLVVTTDIDHCTSVLITALPVSWKGQCHLLSAPAFSVYVVLVILSLLSAF